MRMDSEGGGGGVRSEEEEEAKGCGERRGV